MHGRESGRRFTVVWKNGWPEIWECDHQGKADGYKKDRQLTKELWNSNNREVRNRVVYNFLNRAERGEDVKRVQELLDVNNHYNMGRQLNRKIIADGKPGGVLLGFAADGLERMDNVSYFQILDNGILLIGEKAASSYTTPVNIEWLKTAIYALYYHRQVYVNEPGVTIDPPDNFMNSISMLSNNQNRLDDIPYINSVFSNQNVRFFGGIENTDYGYILFEADRLLKCLAAGRDNINNNITYTSKNVNINGFRNILERSELSKDNTGSVSTRFWFTPEYELYSENNSYYLKGSVKVNTEHTLFGNASFNPDAEQFADFFNSNYGLFEREFSVFGKLRQIAEITCIIQTLKSKGVKADVYKNLSPQKKETPVTTPTICNSLVNVETRKDRNSTQYSISTHIMAGGVDFHKPPKIVNSLNDSHKDTVSEALIEGLLKDGTDYYWEFMADNKAFVAAYLPLQ
jgi:hypothetical protein